MGTKLIHVSGEVHKLGGALEGQAKMIKDDRHITHREMQGRDQGQFKAIREGRKSKVYSATRKSAFRRSRTFGLAFHVLRRWSRI